MFSIGIFHLDMCSRNHTIHAHAACIRMQYSEQAANANATAQLNATIAIHQLQQLYLISDLNN